MERTKIFDPSAVRYELDRVMETLAENFDHNIKWIGHFIDETRKRVKNSGTNVPVTKGGPKTRNFTKKEDNKEEKANPSDKSLKSKKNGTQITPEIIPSDKPKAGKRRTKKDDISKKTANSSQKTKGSNRKSLSVKVTPHYLNKSTALKRKTVTKAIKNGKAKAKEKVDKTDLVESSAVEIKARTRTRGGKVKTTKDANLEVKENVGKPKRGRPAKPKVEKSESKPTTLKRKRKLTPNDEKVKSNLESMRKKSGTKVTPEITSNDKPKTQKLTKKDATSEKTTNSFPKNKESSRKSITVKVTPHYFNKSIALKRKSVTKAIENSKTKAKEEVAKVDPYQFESSVEIKARTIKRGVKVITANQEVETNFGKPKRGRPAKSKVVNIEREPPVLKGKSKLPQIGNRKNVGRPAKEKQTKSTPKISDTPVDEVEKPVKVSILKSVQVYGRNVETGQEIVDKINVTLEIPSVESNSQVVMALQPLLKMASDNLERNSESSVQLEDMVKRVSRETSERPTKVFKNLNLIEEYLSMETLPVISSSAPVRFAMPLDNLEEFGLIGISMGAPLDMPDLASVVRSNLQVQKKTPDVILDSTSNATDIKGNVTIHATNVEKMLTHNISVVNEPENTVYDPNHIETSPVIGSGITSRNDDLLQMLEELDLIRISMGTFLTETHADRSHISNASMLKTANPYSVIATNDSADKNIEKNVTIHTINVEEVLTNNILVANELENTLNHTENLSNFSSAENARPLQLSLTAISLGASHTETPKDRSDISIISGTSLPFIEKTTNPDVILDSTNNATDSIENITIHAANAEQVLPNNISVANEPENALANLNYTETLRGLGSSTPSRYARNLLQILEELDLTRISTGALLEPTLDRPNISETPLLNWPLKAKTANPYLTIVTNDSYNTDDEPIHADVVPTKFPQRSQVLTAGGGPETVVNIGDELRKLCNAASRKSAADAQMNDSNDDELGSEYIQDCDSTGEIDGTNEITLCIRKKDPSLLPSDVNYFSITGSKSNHVNSKITRDY